ncbi:translation initiation factor eIF3 subunit [Macrolepiota fuliginosa MF-IS2]|uniref:Eukaryotic translation initiation factor 3 subunit J n=1 Tax=Macrolepiota fuliginosa MF-IS2 TaxID=1400762 RepID=A0A9P5XIC3_9AGAR|nr:translation initiation factor eIF3 subunit [Macrolepiota fuliginosa MF-IS2]
MSDWESDSDTKPSPAAPKPAVAPPKKSKWEGEDEEGDEPVSDWEESSEEEEEDSKSAPVAPPKKKGTLKQKLAEKEAEKARKKATDGADSDDAEYDSDDVLDPKEKARRDKERQLQADLNNAAELFGAAALGGTSSSELDFLISFQPRTKEDFQALSSKIIEYIIKRHQSKPLYHFFVEHHARELAAPLKDVEVRKAASGLTTLANEKQKEQRDKVSGKKKAKPVKPGLGGAKPSNKLDTSVYDEALDDFGNDPTDFM